MRTLLSIKMREQFFKKINIVMLLIIPIVITCICTYLENEAKNPSKIYNTAIIDYDKTEFSSSFIEKLKEYDGIELFIKKDLDQSLRDLSKGKYDVIYEIKNGFENKILKGEFDNILISHKEINSTDIKWLNDQVSLIVVRQWLYIDILNKIRNLNSNFNEDNFKRKFDESVNKNKILSMKITKINKQDMIKENNESIGVIAFKKIWASIIIFLLISFGKTIIDDRERGIITRLELSGFKKVEYYFTNLILTLLNIIPPFIISYLLMGYFNFQNIFSFIITISFTIIYIIVTWFITLFIGLPFSSKKSYSLAAQIYLLISVILGSGLLDGMYKLTDNVSWLLPIKWYTFLKF